MHWGKGKNQTLGEFYRTLVLNSDSEDPRKTGTSLGSTRESRGLGRLGDQWSFSSGLSRSGSSLVISVAAEVIIGIDILINWQNPYTVFLT